MAAKTPLVNFPLVYPSESTSLSSQALQDLLQSQGVLFDHYRGMPTPLGLTDCNGEYRPLQDNGISTNGRYIESNGFLYVYAGSFTSIFIGITKQISTPDVGHFDQSASQLIIPSTYDIDDCGRTNTDVYVAPFDRLYIKTDPAILVTYWQMYNYDLSGTDRLNFLVEKVIDVVDNQGKSYNQDIDFIVQNGQIKWTGSNRPGIDPVTNRGRVVSIRYLYRPYYYVQHLLHEIRVAQVVNEMTGERKVTRLPQLAVLQREYVFLKKEHNNSPVPPNSRDTLPPGPSIYAPNVSLGPGPTVIK